MSAISLDQDVDTNKELIGHGYSNLLAGFTGSVSDVFIFVAYPLTDSLPANTAPTIWYTSIPSCKCTYFSFYSAS